MFILTDDKMEAIKPLLDLIKEVGNCFIAGGFVSSLCFPKQHQPADIDIFTLNNESFNMMRGKLAWAGYVEERESEAAVTLRNMDNAFNNIPELVQLIKPDKNNLNARDIVNSFDFSINKCYLDQNKAICIADPDFRYHNETKQLVIRNINGPLYTMARILKYSQKGFQIGREDFQRVMDAYANQSEQEKTKEKNWLVMPYLNEISQNFSVARL